MSARPLAGRGLLATALSAAQAWLIAPDTGAGRSRSADVSARPVVLVAGLAPRCGATTVARALGAELAVRDPGCAATVVSDRAGTGAALGTRPAARLARTLANLGEPAPRALGRLCVVAGAPPAELAEAVRYLAPLVLEAGAAGMEASALAPLASRVVLVAAPGVEPALVDVVRAGLAGEGPGPLVAVNRGAEPARWGAHADLVLPESRLGAQLALGGREPPGALGRAVRELADLCEEGR